jgi:hypothetical protein
MGIKKLLRSFMNSGKDALLSVYHLKSVRNFAPDETNEKNFFCAILFPGSLE